jgi:hypothetical protein
VTSCAYCQQPATVHIPSNPEHVCRAHAVEFWTGLLAYVKDRTDLGETRDTPCTCETCIQLSAVNARLTAIEGGVAASRDADSVSLASSRRFTGGSRRFGAVVTGSGAHAPALSAQAADVPGRPEALPSASLAVSVRRI